MAVKFFKTAMSQKKYKKATYTFAINEIDNILITRRGIPQRL